MQRVFVRGLHLRWHCLVNYLKSLCQFLFRSIGRLSFSEPLSNIHSPSARRTRAFLCAGPLRAPCRGAQRTLHGHSRQAPTFSPTHRTPPASLSPRDTAERTNRRVCCIPAPVKDERPAG